MLDRALFNLRHKIDMVMMTDTMDLGLFQLKFHTRFVPRSFFKWPVLNKVRRGPSVLSEAAQDIVRKWVWREEILYRAALKVHAEQSGFALACLEVGFETDALEREKQEN
jgi:hypothetical protein